MRRARSPGRDRPPRRKRRRGPRHGGVDLVGPGARDLLEHRLGGGLEHVAACRQATPRLRLDASAPSSANSIVRIGPLNVRLAETTYQIVTAAITRDRHDRRVVDRRPAEAVLEEHPGLGWSAGRR